MSAAEVMTVVKSIHLGSPHLSQTARGRGFRSVTYMTHSPISKKDAVWSAKVLMQLFNKKYSFYREVLRFSDEKSRHEAERFVDAVMSQ
jgi:hypothetical protein